MYKRIEHYKCGHTFTLGEESRYMRMTKCPTCGIGDYDGSLVESDEREEPEARIIEQNPDRTYGTTIFQPINPTQWASISAGTTASAYATIPINPPQTVSNGQIFSIPINGTAAFDWASVPTGDVPVQVIPEGHPLPSADHDPATCRICIAIRRRYEEQDVEINSETHTNYSETDDQE